MEAVCQVCMHHCRLAPGQTGLCRARKNRDGSIICANYGQVTSLALDPIEKKPLRMFHPGSLILSVGSFGCNLRCPFCQNHQISMTGPKESGAEYLSPEELAGTALKYRPAGNIGAAFTYNEPLVGWEYVLDTAKLVRAYGMKNVLVTNGCASPQILEKLLPYIDAMNIDLKGFRNDYYRKLGGDLDTVKEFITLAASRCHVELTTLIVPGENDTVEEMEAEARWIASLKTKNHSGRPGSSSSQCPPEPGLIPLHVTRFFPQYHMRDRAATDVDLVYRLADTARKYLANVFVGNC